MYPRYKKTGASSLIRLGYNKQLTGGIAARPSFPFSDSLMDNLVRYSSLPNQQYPLNVRLEMVLISSHNVACIPPYAALRFGESQNLYQKVKNACERNNLLIRSIFRPLRLNACVNS